MRTRAPHAELGWFELADAGGGPAHSEPGVVHLHQSVVRRPQGRAEAVADGIRACARGVRWLGSRVALLTSLLVCLRLQFSGLTQEIYSVPLPYAFKGRPFSAVSLDMYQVCGGMVPRAYASGPS